MKLCRLLWAWGRYEWEKMVKGDTGTTSQPLLVMILCWCSMFPRCLCCFFLWRFWGLLLTFTPSFGLSEDDLLLLLELWLDRGIAIADLMRLGSPG